VSTAWATGRIQIPADASEVALHDDDPGPLLPGSTVPAIVVARERLAAAMRESAGRPHLR
jgi:hypothetical protein